jgi:hypothetical protein
MTSSTLQSYFHYHEGSSSPSLSSSSSSSAFSSSSSSHSNSSGYPWRRQPNSAAISSLRNSSDSFPSSSLCFWRGRAPLPAPYLETNWRQRSPIQSSTIPDTVLTGTGIAHFTDSELTGLIARLPFVREEIPLDVSLTSFLSHFVHLAHRSAGSHPRGQGPLPSRLWRRNFGRAPLCDP